MGNAKLFLQDFIDCEIRLTHMTSDFAYLEFKYKDKTFYSQLAINMQAPLEGKPLMAGILEKDPLIHRYFYIGKICAEIQSLELSSEGAITISNTNHLAHTFDLTIPGKNSIVQTPWYVFQEEEYPNLDEQHLQSVLFECNQHGEITTPEKKSMEPVNIPRKWNEGLPKDSDDNLQKLKGTTLYKINFPNQRFYFRKDAELFELRAINPIEFQGLFLLKKEAMKEQYPHCEFAVEICMLAQLLDKEVTAVTKKDNGDLYVDFDNKTTLLVIGDPPFHNFNDDSLWDLINSKTGEWLSTYIKGQFQRTEHAQRKRGEISESTLLENLKVMVRLQKEALDKLAQKHPVVLDSEFVNQFPKRGFVEFNGSLWEFRKYSEGYLFIEAKSRRELAMYRDFQNPNNLEAWRIYSYLNSVFKDIRIEHEFIRRLMNALAEKSDSPIEKIGDRYFWNETNKKVDQSLHKKIGDFIVKRKKQ
ncbi:MAG: hypothetical protein SFY67_08685 [Candidatus Melainabacteria bacterium]|nr:hypothetical protein [Candidatus Melainabacteria bacterium]